MEEKGRILVVEDEFVIAMDLQRILTNLGYDVPMTVSSGVEAIEKARELKPDLILMDIVLQGEIDGVQAAEVIHSELGIPLIFLTSYADDKTVQRAKTAEPAGYIIKPFDERELRTTVELVIYKANMERKAQAYWVERRKMEALSVMAAGVAHEINTPLTIISYVTEDIRDAVKAGGEHLSKIDGYLKKIDDTVKRIANITKGMLAFAKGDSLSQFTTVAVRSILDDAYGICVDKFARCGVDLSIEGTCSAELRIECQAIEIVQVLVNLMNNAKEAVSELEEKWVKLGLKDLGEKVQFTVTDSGKGIPPEIASRILEPFFTTKQSNQGTGLGLSIAKAIIDSHQGTLELDSKSPNTCFLVSLPKRPLKRAARS